MVWVYLGSSVSLMSNFTKLMKQAASGAGGGAGEYVEDLFQTFVYEGDTSTSSRKLDTGMDFDGKGGLAWFKRREQEGSNYLFDTERTNLYYLQSDRTNAATAQSTPADLISFNTDGVNVGQNNPVNANGEKLVLWQFLKAQGFFDIVTWTGNGTAGRQISHNLDSVPAFIITKRLDGADNWKCYHVGNPSPAEDHVIELDNSNAAGNEAIFYDTAPTSTYFTVSSGGAINGSGMTYVAYLFASDDQRFGDNGDESIIKCGSFTGSSGTEIDLGWEPQWIMFKNRTSAGNWQIIDTARGFFSRADDRQLMANLFAVESNNNLASLTPSGFEWLPSAASSTYIYIAIRRPMKIPEAGVDAKFLGLNSYFSLNAYTETNDYQQITTGNYVDWGWQWLNGDGFKFFTRMLGAGYFTTGNAALNTSAASLFDYMNGFEPHYANNVGGYSPRQVFGFTKARGFFDVVVYQGSNSSYYHDHNLGAVPELMFVKCITGAETPWKVYYTGIGPDYELDLGSSAAKYAGSSWDNASDVGVDPTDTQFHVKAASAVVNNSNHDYVNYLFASVDNVCKIGTYSGSSSNIDLTIGFLPSLFIVKKLDSGTSGGGNWIMWNYALGIVAGNDPRVRINSGGYYTTTDCVDPINNGIRILTGNTYWNEAGSDFLYIAIA